MDIFLGLNSVGVQLGAAFAFLNILLLLSILYVYLQNLSKARTPFTVGLTAFALLFLFQNIGSLYLILTMMPYFVDPVEQYLFLLTILQTIAFAVMAWLTWK